MLHHIILYKYIYIDIDIYFIMNFWLFWLQIVPPPPTCCHKCSCRGSAFGGSQGNVSERTPAPPWLRWRRQSTVGWYWNLGGRAGLRGLRRQTQANHQVQVRNKGSPLSWYLLIVALVCGRSTFGEGRLSERSVWVAVLLLTAFILKLWWINTNVGRTLTLYSWMLFTVGLCLHSFDFSPLVWSRSVTPF